MENFQLPGLKVYDTQMVIHSETSTNDVILVQQFQRHFINVARKHGLIDQGKYKNGQLNKSVHKRSIM